MWQWITYLPVKSLKWPATTTRSPGSSRKVSFRQLLVRPAGGLPLRGACTSRCGAGGSGGRPWCGCGAPRSRSCPSFGKASERAGSKVLPLISQVGIRPLADRELPLACGAWRGVARPNRAAGAARRDTLVSSARLADPELASAGRGGASSRPAAALAAGALQLDPLAREPAEVDDQLDPLAGADQHLRRRTGAGIRPLSVAIWVSWSPLESSRL